MRAITIRRDGAFCVFAFNQIQTHEENMSTKSLIHVVGSMLRAARLGLNVTSVLLILALLLGTPVRATIIGPGDGDWGDWEPYGFEPVELAELGTDGVYRVWMPESLAEHLEAMWRELRELKVNGPVDKQLDGNGAVCRAKPSVESCPQIDHGKDRLAAYRTDWLAHAILTYEFGLKGSNTFGLEVDGAIVDSVNGVRTSRVIRKVDVWFSWVACEQTLYVRVSNFRSVFIVGPQSEIGKYFVIGRSVGSFEAKDVNLTTNVSDSGYSIEAAIETVAGKKKMKVVTKGFAYQMEYGVFSAVVSNWGQTFEWGFGSSYITEAEMNYEEDFAVVTDLMGNSKTVINFGFNVEDETADESVEVSGENSTGITSSTLAVWSSWNVFPTYNTVAEEFEGLWSKIRFVSQKNPNQTVTTYLQPRFGTKLNWSFEAGASGEEGGGIQVDNAGTTEKATKKINLRNF
ncbi:MAG: hypothetical protein ACKVP0_13355 [Pirellulaceae bacterium]